MCVIDLEPCEVWREQERTARKEHRCSACRGRIGPGERYVEHFSKFEGEVATEKLCTPCGQDRREFASEHDGMLPVPSALPWTLEECIAEGDEESERRWKPMLAALRARAAA